MPKRVYNEEEVAALFQRAAELQVERGRRPAAKDARSGDGLSFEELLTIASDSGLDPELLRHAVAELDAPQTRSSRKGKSGAESYAEYTFAGILDDHAIEDIVAELRHRYDSSAGESMGMPSYGRGRTETIGRSTEWRQTDPWTGNETRVLLQPRPDGTRVRLSKKNVWGMDSTHGKLWAVMIALFVAFFAGPVSGSFLVALAVLVVLVLTMVPIFSHLEKRTIGKREAEFEDLADMISSHLRVLPSASGHDAPPLREVQPEIDLDFDAPQDARSVRSSQRTRSR